jgi:hypothetical protein
VFLAIELYQPVGSGFCYAERFPLITMSYNNAWKEGNGDFLLVISGSTCSSPFLTGWQEFKDHIRKVVKEQPGWVDVYSSQSQRRDEMQGWARLRDRGDADAAYSKS